MFFYFGFPDFARRKGVFVSKNDVFSVLPKTGVFRVYSPAGEIGVAAVPICARKYTLVFLCF